MHWNIAINKYKTMSIQEQNAQDLKANTIDLQNELIKAFICRTSWFY